jgi:hypothetical protein
MGRATPAEVLEPGEVGSSTDPAALLAYAWAMEPGLALAERYRALDHLEALLDAGLAPSPPPGRDWAMELLAERAIDAAAYVRLLEAQELAARVLEAAAADAAIARARATLARGRALAWMGTEEATRQGDAALRAAIEQFRALGDADWLGFTVFWRGHAICFQNGDLQGARDLMGDALEILGPASPRRAPILTFYADVLTDLGDYAGADAALDDAAAIAQRDEAPRSRAYVAWSRAHVAAGRDDRAATAVLLAAVERDAGDWFATMTGLDFLADAANQLDRVGSTDRAQTYLRRARERVLREGTTTEDGSPYDEPLLQAEASIMARSGDPHLALTKLQILARGNWLEKRLIWRNTLLTAWATLRAGAREDAGVIAARALAEATGTGGIGVAVAGEGPLTRALAPLADEAGSEHARDLLSGHTKVMIRLFGVPTVTRPDGQPVRLPAGMPGELVRRLALSPHGLGTDRLLAEFFPDTERAVAQARLRQILSRLRAETGDLVHRDGELLTLVPAWVDVLEFGSLLERFDALGGSRRIVLGWSALALAQRGPLLPGDPYAIWAEPVRERVMASAAELSAALA